MALIRPRSAHVLSANRTGMLMCTVILATVPGLLTLTWFFGWGPLITVVWACLVATACEALALSLRRRPVRFYLRDCSALVTGAMMGLALPHYAPWWLTLTGVGFAIVVAKHLYGGMGFNPFNPAMVGYALLLMAFPEPMTNNWATPAALLQTGAPDFLTTLGYIFGGHIPGGIDGYTAATPLTTLKMQANADAVATVVATPGLDNTIGQIWKKEWGQDWGSSWQWAGLAFLAGGLLLIERRIITWHIPVSMLGALLLCLLLFGEDRSRSMLLLHLFGGGTVLAAFFVATDPVTSCASKLGLLAYGFGLGVLTFVLRKAGGYADAAFAVLLMNFASPYIDRYTRPRTYGHAKARRGPGGKRQ